MNPRQNNLILLFLLLFGFPANAALSQTVAPAAKTFFQIPLADKTIADAVIWPTPDGQTLLLYSTPTGKIFVYQLTSLGPQPEPTPPTPPTPNPTPPTPPNPPEPIPQKLTIAVVEDPRTTTQAQKQLLVDCKWRCLAVANHNFVGIVPYNIIDKRTGKTPANLQSIIQASQGQILPCFEIFDSNMGLLYSAHLPNSADQIATIIHKYGGP
jgi:hypothetical protein